MNVCSRDLVLYPPPHAPLSSFTIDDSKGISMFLHFISYFPLCILAFCIVPYNYTTVCPTLYRGFVELHLAVNDALRKTRGCLELKVPI